MSLTTGYDKTARLWDISTGQEVRQFVGHTGFVTPPVFSSDGRYIVSGSADRTARLREIWPEVEPRRLVTIAVHDHLVAANTLTLSLDQQVLLVGRIDGTIQLWDMSRNQLVRRINFETTSINAQAISVDNRQVAAGDGTGKIHLADAHTGKVTKQFAIHSGPVWDVIFSADGEYALSGGEDQTATLWQVESGQEVQRFAGHSGAVRAVAFSPDGSAVLTGSDDGTARLWDSRNGREQRQFRGHSAAVLDVAFSPDGRLVLTGSADRTARLWDAATGRALQTFVGHTAQVTRVAFSPDGRLVLTGSADQTVRLWDVATGLTIRQFVDHDTAILFVGFSADGRSVLSGDARTTFAWRTALEDVVAFACEQLSRDLSAEERAFYNITDTRPTCLQLAEQMAAVAPTWTPVPPGGKKELPLALSVEMEFVSEAANVQMGAPVQDVFVDAGNRQVVRPTVLNAETLALPIYSAAVEVPLDVFEAPFDIGSYPKGAPLGFTLGDYIAAEGRGTYTVVGDRAIVELTFERLVPNGLYTAWCNIFSSRNASIKELPCVAPDGSAYAFTADKDGRAELRMDIAAFPPSTEDATYEIAFAYHSDGQAYGASAGQHGRNTHGQLFYDFLPPANQ